MSAACSKVSAWVSSLPPADRDLPLISCCHKLWSPNEILAACLAGSREAASLIQILEAHGFGTGDSPVDVEEIARRRLERILRGVHVLIAQNPFVLSPEELLRKIREGRGIGRRLLEAEILRMVEQVSKYG